jgi:hypothetical protein
MQRELFRRALERSRPPRGRSTPITSAQTCQHENLVCGFCRRVLRLCRCAERSRPLLVICDPCKRRELARYSINVELRITATDITPTKRPRTEDEP